MNVAILGCGGIAHAMGRTLRGIVEKGITDIIPYAAASRSLEKAQAFAKEFQMKKAYGSYEEMVCDPEVDLVYIATPHSEHYANMKLCIDHGKAVLCEKAFTANAEQARDILAYAKEKKVLVTEAIWVRYMPFISRLREIIASGVIGEITMLATNLHYAVSHNARITDPVLCGGALLDVGIYPLTFASLIFGDDYTSMSAVGTKYDTGVDKQSVVTLFYPDGKMAVLNSGASAISDRKAILYGSKGFIIVENVNNPESIAVYQDYQQISFEKVPEQITGYEYEVYACKKALDEHALECPECPHAQSIRMMEIMDEARKQMGIVYPYDK